MGRFNDLTGQKFGRWTVLYRGEDRYNKQGYPRIYWTCKCDCGTIRDVSAVSLVNKQSTSCGCKRKESCAKNVKHGLSGTRIKRIYYNMHSRCENPNTPKFKNHGGRGIKVCDEWSGEDGLINFYNWAMSNGYKEDLTIDRIDDDRDYEPSNCQWADYRTQNLNTRRNNIVTINGVTKTVTEWSEESGINRNTLDQRLRSGITGEDLLAPLKLCSGYSSGFTGVMYRKDSGKWRVTITKDGIRHNIGTYESLEDAVNARLNSEIKYYGKYLSDIDEVTNKLKQLESKEG